MCPESRALRDFRAFWQKYLVIKSNKNVGVTFTKKSYLVTVLSRRAFCDAFSKIGRAFSQHISGHPVENNYYLLKIITFDTSVVAEPVDIYLKFPPTMYLMNTYDTGNGWNS